MKKTMKIEQFGSDKSDDKILGVFVDETKL